MAKKHKKRKGGSGNRKGGAFERDVCRALSRFINPKSSETMFWRSSMSGGRATVQARKGIKNKNQAGDITCIHPEGQWFTDLFVVECKHVANLNLTASMLDGRGKLAAFWKKHCKLASDNDLAPLMIAKQNRTDTLVIFDKAGLQKFRTFGHEVTVIATSRMLIKGQLAYLAKFKAVFGGK